MAPVPFRSKSGHTFPGGTVRKSALRQGWTEIQAFSCPKASFVAGLDRISGLFLSEGQLCGRVGQKSRPFSVQRSLSSRGWTGFRAFFCPKVGFAAGLDRNPALFLSEGQHFGRVRQDSGPFPVQRSFLIWGCACRQRAPGGGQAEPELVFLQTCQKNNSGPPIVQHAFLLKNNRGRTGFQAFSCPKVSFAAGLDRIQCPFLSKGQLCGRVGQDSAPFSVRKSALWQGWTGFQAFFCPKVSSESGSDRIQCPFLSRERQGGRGNFVHSRWQVPQTRKISQYLPYDSYGSLDFPGILPTLGQQKLHAL